MAVYFVEIHSEVRTYGEFRCRYDVMVRQKSAFSAEYSLR